MILGICFFLVREKGEKIRGGGGQIYWTYSLLVPKNRHSELVLKKVKLKVKLMVNLNKRST